MRLVIPHRIIYETDEPVPVSDVIDSLLGAERILFEIAPVLEGLVDGLAIEPIGIAVSEISQNSPLREILFYTLFLTFQKDLEGEVPTVIETLTGIRVSDSYDTIVTLVFCMLFFYGLEAIASHVRSAGPDRGLKKQMDSLTEEVAADLNVSPEKVRKVLEGRYEKRGFRRIVQDAALKVLAPSRRQRNAPILIGSRRIPQDIVAQVPNDASLLDPGPADKSVLLQNIAIELHAQDLDHNKQGWAAVVPSLSKNRMRMYLFPPITPEQIYTKTKITGDVIVVSKKLPDGNYKPYLLHLVRLRN